MVRVLNKEKNGQNTWTYQLSYGFGMQSNATSMWLIEFSFVEMEWQTFLSCRNVLSLGKFYSQPQGSVRSSWLKKHPSFVALSSGHIRITRRAFKLQFLSCLLLPKFDNLFWGEAHALVLLKHSQVILVQPELGICGLKESLRGRRETTLNTRCVVLQHSFSGVYYEDYDFNFILQVWKLLNYFSKYHTEVVELNYSPDLSNSNFPHTYFPQHT